MHIFIEGVGDTITGERSAIGVPEYRLVCGVGVNDLAQGCIGFRPQGAKTLLTPLAMEPGLPRPVKPKLPRADTQSFTDTGTGVVEEQQQGPIPRCVGFWGSTAAMTARASSGSR
jgi:hypothetical protein